MACPLLRQRQPNHAALTALQGTCASASIMSARSFRSTSRSMLGVAAGDFGVAACCVPPGSPRVLAAAPPPASAPPPPGALLGRASLGGAADAYIQRCTSTLHPDCFQFLSVVHVFGHQSSAGSGSKDAWWRHVSRKMRGEGRTDDADFQRPVGQRRARQRRRLCQFRRGVSQRGCIHGSMAQIPAVAIKCW